MSSVYPKCPLVEWAFPESESDREALAYQANVKLPMGTPSIPKELETYELHAIIPSAHRINLSSTSRSVKELVVLLLTATGLREK